MSLNKLSVQSTKAKQRPYGLKLYSCFIILVKRRAKRVLHDIVSPSLLPVWKAWGLLPSPEGHIQFHPVNSYGHEGGARVPTACFCVRDHYFLSLRLRLINSSAVNGQWHQSRKRISPPLHFHIYKYNKSLILSQSPPERGAAKTSVHPSVQRRRKYTNGGDFIPGDEMMYELSSYGEVLQRRSSLYWQMWDTDFIQTDLKTAVCADLTYSVSHSSKTNKHHLFLFRSSSHRTKTHKWVRP